MENENNADKDFNVPGLLAGIFSICNRMNLQDGGTFVLTTCFPYT